MKATGNHFVNETYRSAPGSPIRELKRFSEMPVMLSLAGGYPAAELMDASGLQALLGALPVGDFSRALEYGGTEGAMVLRTELSKLSNARGLRTQPQDLLNLSGSQQGIDLLARTVLERGDVVLVEAPTYPAALSAFRFAGARIHQMPTDAHGLVIDGLDEMFLRLMPRLLYIVPTFGNPSGRTLPADRRLALLELAARHRCLLVEDDPYGELWFDAPPPAPIHSMRHEVDGGEAVSVYLSSLSKTLAPGLRLGWMLGPTEVRRACVLAKQADDMHASSLTQALAASYLAQGLFDEALPRLRATYAARSKALAAALRTSLGSSIEFDAPAGGMFIWARIEGVDTSALLPIAIEHQVLFVPGAAFFAAPHDTDMLRLSFAAQDEKGIADGAGRLAKAIAQMR